MGAIFGVLGGCSEADLQAMGERLAHRGPRVAVITAGHAGALGTVCRDPAAATATRGPLTIVCDGAVYNGSELSAKLSQHQLEPWTESPAAMLLALYEVFGLEALELVEGDFACIIADRDRCEHVLARDFFGCRSLYFARLPGSRLAFASEYKALLGLPDLAPEADRDMVQYIQCAKHLPPGRTLLANVSEVLPGTATRMATSGAMLESHACPPLQVAVDTTDEDEAARLVRSTLSEAVRRRTADLDRIGLALSGGIDSIAVAFLLRQLHPDKEIHTFTAGTDADDPEIRTAAKVAARIGARHHEVFSPPELMKTTLRELVWHLEGPLARSETLQLLQVGRAARPHVDVLLTAQGADRLFAGSPKYMVFYLMQLLPMLRPGLRDLYNLTQLSLPPRTLQGKLLARIYDRGKVPPVPRVQGARLPQRAKIAFGRPEFINRNMVGEFTLSRKFELTFAAAGLEHRSPFCDVALARAAYTITDKLKIRRRTAKYILRKALASIVDDEFRDLPKFPQRMKYDLAFAEALDEVAHEVLDDAAVRRRGLFEPDSIRALFCRRPGQTYAAEAAMRIWTAVLTEYWAKLFLDKPATASTSPDSVEQSRISSAVA